MWGVGHQGSRRGPTQSRRRPATGWRDGDGGGTEGAPGWALLENPKDLTTLQRTTVAGLSKTNLTVYRAYLLKEQMRAVFASKGEVGVASLAGWVSWAANSRLAPFVKLARTITHDKPLILNTLRHGLSNARSEATNVHLWVSTGRAYGFHSPEALTAMAMAHTRRSVPRLARPVMNTPTETGQEPTSFGKAILLA